MPWPVCRIIPSAFRLQPAADFTLEVNRTALPSLMDPGIDWLYLSTVLGVEEGSNHGYDVVGPTHVVDTRCGEIGL